MEAYRTAKYDILWVIDSNVSVVPDTLLHSLASFNSKSPSAPRVGLVHHVPYAVASERDSTIGTQLERAFLNTNHAKMYIALNTLAIESCVMGKSNLFRRSDIEKINASNIPLQQQQPYPGEVRGLASVAKFAGEDSMIGTAIWHELGLAHVLSVNVAANALGPMSFTAYLSRRARWIRVRKGTVIAATLLEPFTESVFAGTLAAIALSYIMKGEVSVWMGMLLNWAIFLTIDLDVRYVLTEKPFGSWSEMGMFVMAWMGRELLAFPIWLYAICGNEIDWRGEKYKMLWGGEVLRVRSTVQPGGVVGRLAAGVLGRPSRGGYEPLLSHVP
jgi:ceramide glucosyltransferase